MRLAVVVSGFPRRSETFALHELIALERAGRLAAVIATKPGDPGPAQPGASRLVMRLVQVRGAGPDDLAEEVARAARAAGASALHGYFAHTPSTVAHRAAQALGLGFSLSAHARDVRKADPAALAGAGRDARVAIACNADVARDLARFAPRTRLIPHGVDLARFVPAAAAGPRGALSILAVGRLVPKKGFEGLLEAVAKLRIPFRLAIVGAGPLRARLVERAGAFGLDSAIDWIGALEHDALPARYARADVVVVPSIVDAEGDRDGLPNVLLEAMACGRAVVASRVAAIPDAIDDGREGCLVEPGDPVALAAALERLFAEPSLRAALGARARRRVEQEHALDRCTARFVSALETAHA